MEMNCIDEARFSKYKHKKKSKQNVWYCEVKKFMFRGFWNDLRRKFPSDRIEKKNTWIEARYKYLTEKPSLGKNCRNQTVYSIFQEKQYIKNHTHENIANCFCLVYVPILHIIHIYLNEMTINIEHTLNKLLLI